MLLSCQGVLRITCIEKKNFFKPSNQFKYILSISYVPITVLSTRVGWGIGLDTERITNAVCVLKLEDHMNTHKTKNNLKIKLYVFRETSVE